MHRARRECPQRLAVRGQIIAAEKTGILDIKSFGVIARDSTVQIRDEERLPAINEELVAARASKSDVSSEAFPGLRPTGAYCPFWWFPSGAVTNISGISYRLHTFW